MKIQSFLAVLIFVFTGTDPLVLWGQAPQSVGTGPETWFHIIGGNASKEGLTADLEAIRDAGLSGIQFFHGGFHSGVTPWPGLEERQIPCLSAAWDDLTLAPLLYTLGVPSR